MKQFELLSPAGNMESLKAAIAGGCDAVYLGGTMFGARAFSNNFNDIEIVEAISFSHIYGVKVYVTLNTLVYEREVDKFISYIDFLYKANVDAIIIQDIGMMDLVRQTYPDLEVHASTQMHIHNLEGVKLVEELGVKRAVLARETDLDTIKHIKENTNIELEIFVHGALCVSYSGQCLMSSMIGGRSGNRGTCAGTCRQLYSLYDEENNLVETDKYLLSMKDLNGLSDIGKLIDIGVDSFKIEGRMKSPEYVYVVTSIYRKAIDNYIKYGETKVSDKDIRNLEVSFNREFTSGFLNGKEDVVNSERPNHKGIEIGKVSKVDGSYIEITLTDYVNINDGIRIINKITDVGSILNNMFVNRQLVKSAKKGDVIRIMVHGEVSVGDFVYKTSDSYLNSYAFDKIKEFKKISINENVILKENERLVLKLSDGINEVVVKSDSLLEIAMKHPMSKEQVYEQLNKLGNTPFIIDKLDVDYNEDLFISIKMLNEIRRQAVDELISKRQYKYDYVKGKYKRVVPEFDDNKFKSILINNTEDYNKVSRDVSIIYVEDREMFDELDDSRLVYKLPRIINKFEKIEYPLLVGELGSVYKYKDIVTDYSLNVVNSYSVALLHSLGVNRVTLSYELNGKQTCNLIDAYINRYGVSPNLEIIASGYPEVMAVKYDLLNDKGLGYLKDRFNNKYRLVKKDGFINIINFEEIEVEDIDNRINVIRKFV